MFWIKPSVINVDCFTFNDTAYTNFAPDIASKFYPKEFKKLDNSIRLKNNPNINSKLMSEMNTIRLCNGVTDLYTNGFILPSWQDIILESTIDGNIFLDERTSNMLNKPAIQIHDRWQFGNDLYPAFNHVKLLSHWFFKEKTGVQFTWNMCDWDRSDIADKVRILSAVLDFKHQTATNVNMFIKKDSTISYNAGDPLVHLIPLSEKRVKIHKHLLSVEEYDRTTIMQGVKMSYNNHRKLTAEAKCPFGFGK
jgi:hypothetical protein